MRNYKYGAYAPTENAALVQQQFRLAHAYQCALVMIERERRLAIDDLYKEACPAEHAALEAAEQAALAAHEEMSRSRSTGGDMLEPDEDMKAERRELLESLKLKLEAAREVQKHARQAWYDAKKRVESAVRPRLKEIEGEAFKANSRAYNLAGTVGLAWGTRLKVAEWAERAAKAAQAEGSLPKFPRFNGGGAVYVQLQCEWVLAEDLPSPEMAARLPTRLAVLDESAKPKRWRQVEREGGRLFVVTKKRGEDGARRFEYEGESALREQYHLGLDYAGVMEATDTRFRIEALGMSEWQGARGKDAVRNRDRVHYRCPFCGHKWSGRSAGGECRCGGVGERELVAAPSETLPQPKGGGKAESWLLGLARLRVGTADGQPVWAAWPVRLQRDHLPPADAIKWACVSASKVGSRTEWNLTLTVDESDPDKRTEGHSLAVNLGWRNLSDGGLRVAYAVGSDGREEEVRVPPAFIEGMRRVNSYRSIRDERFQVLKRDLREWVDEGERPKWLVDEVEYIEDWRSQKRLARLVLQWGRNRFDGDERVFRRLVEWEERDRHIRFWECDERESLLRMRKDFYRTLAARWCSEYVHVFVTDMNLRDFAELPDPAESAKSEGAAQRQSRTLAAPSELRAAIENAAGKRGTCCPRLVKRNRKQVEEGACSRHVGVARRLASPYKTQTCASCGIAFAFAAKQDLVHACECGATWDQDANHCRNLLASGEATSENGGPLAANDSFSGSEGKKGRWGKRLSKSESQVVDSVLKTG